MKWLRGILCIVFCLAVMQGLVRPPRRDSRMEPAVAFFRTQARVFAASLVQLQQAIEIIQVGDTMAVLKARHALTQCRINYKRIEFFLEYFFTSSAAIYNRAPRYEIEEPYMEYQEPIGLQLMESLLFEQKPEEKKQQLIEQVAAVSSSANDLASLLYGFQGSEAQLMESIRLELVRVIVLHIAGYDAPLLRSGIAEAAAAMEALQQVLTPFTLTSGAIGDSVVKYLTGSIHFLQQHPGFDHFDRLAFLTQYALPLQRQLGQLTEALNLKLPAATGALNLQAADLFSADALNITAFPGVHLPDTTLVSLGRELFFETGLSGNNKISCATCHDPDKHFTDALPQSMAFDGHAHVQRNAPSLLYAGFQYGQFWDGRAKTLEEQVKTVLSSPQEMNGGVEMVATFTKQKPLYAALLKQLFPVRNDTATLLDEVSYALAAFVRSLNPRNARFDQYMQGDQSKLTAKEINGFNLFMGKAQCGTCHFAPLFNGLTPPLYDLSELEVLGTTQTEELEKPIIDTDSGRYKVFPIEYYDKAFKTPTVRNVSATGPYMHNGAFKTLEAVVEFYSKGGAVGLGLQLPNQTLSARPLNLSKEEVNNIVSFLHALEDTIPNLTHNR